MKVCVYVCVQSSKSKQVAQHAFNTFMFCLFDFYQYDYVAIFFVQETWVEDFFFIL